jgi:hypothetical protein
MRKRGVLHFGRDKRQLDPVQGAFGTELSHRQRHDRQRQVDAGAARLHEIVAISGMPF